jgi:hypothetical protein
MNINKIKNAFSFIEMESIGAKITTLSLISGIVVLLFTHNIIFSSSDKSFSGELTDGLAVLMNVKHPKDSFFPVNIKTKRIQKPYQINQGE